ELAAGFAWRFVLIGAPLFFLLNWLPRPWVEEINLLTARLTGLSLGLLGLQALVRGVEVSAQGFAVRIITECSAAFVAVLFAAFVAAFPAPWKKRLAGLMLGIPFLFLLNQVRLLLVFLTGVHHPELFDHAHLYFGQVAMFLAVLLAALLWLRYGVALTSLERIAGFAGRFLLFSLPPFLLWLLADEPFVRLNLLLVQLALGQYGSAVVLPERLEIFPHTFTSYTLVVYIGLVLACRGVPWQGKRRALVRGLAVLVACHFLFRLTQALYFQVGLREALSPFVALVIINQWVLPFGLWLWLARREVFRPPGIPLCPICGAEDWQIRDHIRIRHPRQYDTSPEVQALLGSLPPPQPLPRR
ncbi:MAG: exosortase H, partial [Thermodesulfobacteriota bacterium]